MTRKTEYMNDLARQDADRIMEGYRKGGHTCRECGRVAVCVGGCKEFNDKVKSLLAKEGVSLAFDGDWIIDGYCPDCRWEKRGLGLDIEVIVRVTRGGKESVNEIIERLKSRLEDLGLSFEIEGFTRRHLIEERGWQ